MHRPAEAVPLALLEVIHRLSLGATSLRHPLRMLMQSHLPIPTSLPYKMSGPCYNNPGLASMLPLPKTLPYPAPGCLPPWPPPEITRRKRTMVIMPSPASRRTLPGWLPGQTTPKAWGMGILWLWLLLTRNSLILGLWHAVLVLPMTSRLLSTRTCFWMPLTP